MPQLGETVTEGTITRWLKNVGDQVAEDEVLFEVSTDKVDSEVPSPASGVVSEILVPEGDTVDVGTRLAVVSDAAAAAQAPPAGEAAPEPEAAPAPEPEQEVAEAPAPPAAAPAPAAEAAPRAPAEAPRAPAAEPAPRTAAPASAGVPSPSAEEAPAPTPIPEPAGAGPVPEQPGRVLSPVVRRLISEHHLDPAQITGTGAGGRITRSDVLGLIDRRGGAGGNGAQAAPAAPAPEGRALAAPPTQPAPAAGAPPTQAPPPAAEAGEGPGDRDEVVPFTNIRRRTAEHMVRSKHTSAHTMVAVDVDYSAVDKVRRAERERFRAAEGISLNYLPFIARATVDAIIEWPHINSSVGDNQLIVHHDINLGIAVDLDFEGLMVPVIHRAEGKRLRQLAREIASQAEKARTRRVTMDDISGGTFTLTNAGPFGTLMTIPVINQPQVAILSTDGVRKRPVAVELPDGSDGIAVHPVGNLVMSWDHRAVDGAYAAAFVHRIKEILETRDWSVEL
jgi:pyruvate dehydrogenase E2 component (dihydrolipoamide acetyltransferase)